MDHIDDDRLTLTAAARHIGVNKATLNSRLEQAGVTLFCDPRDLRKKLVSQADLDRVFNSRPIEHASNAR